MAPKKLPSKIFCREILLAFRHRNGTLAVTLRSTHTVLIQINLVSMCDFVLCFSRQNTIILLLPRNTVIGLRNTVVIKKKKTEKITKNRTYFFFFLVVMAFFVFLFCDTAIFLFFSSFFFSRIRKNEIWNQQPRSSVLP